MKICMTDKISIYNKVTETENLISMETALIQIFNSYFPNCEIYLPKIYEDPVLNAIKISKLVAHQVVCNLWLNFAIFISWSNLQGNTHNRNCSEDSKHDEANVSQKYAQIKFEPVSSFITWQFNNAIGT